MKKIVVPFYLFLLCSSAFGESIIEYDPDSAIVSNRVVRYLRSVDSGPYMETPNCVTCPIANHLIDPDLSAVSGVERTHWKVEGGAIVEMTQKEKDDLALDAANKIKQGKIDAINNLGITAQTFAQALINMGIVSATQLKEQIKTDKGLN
jgi:hypothetical protein